MIAKRRSTHCTQRPISSKEVEAHWHMGHGARGRNRAELGQTGLGHSVASESNDSEVPAIVDILALRANLWLKFRATPAQDLSRRFAGRPRKQTQAHPRHAALGGRVGSAPGRLYQRSIGGVARKQPDVLRRGSLGSACRNGPSWLGFGGATVAALRRSRC